MPRTSRPITRDQGRRIEFAYDVCPQAPGLVQGLSPARPTVAFAFQYQKNRPQGAVGWGPVLSISAAATFGLRDPDMGATVCVLMPTERAPIRPHLSHLIALLLREAACAPTRFRQTGLNVLLYAPEPTSLSVAAPLSQTLDSALTPGDWRLRVPDLAGHQYAVPATLQNVTFLAGKRMRDLQLLTRVLRTDADYRGDVNQNMAALRRTDQAEYVRVAAHQARLALFFGVVGYRWYE